MHQTKTDGTYWDSDGHIVAFDPSIHENGPSVLLISKQKFIEFLTSKNYNVFWTILGEKRVIGDQLNRRYWPGRLEISGAYRLDQQSKIAGKAKTKFIAPSEPKQ